jgi:sarcosine oxidase, subunit beta
LPETAEVVVVGGGVVGCSVAYQLAKCGVEVVLLERDELGSHSTARNAGGVRHQFTTAVNVKVQLLSIRLLQEFESEFGISPGFRKIGYLFSFTKQRDADLFRQLVPTWHELGLHDANWVEPEEVAALSRALNPEGILGGTYCPSDGIASPTDVTYGLATGARRLGAKLYEGRQVDGLELTRGRITAVRTPAGTISCDTVIVCAGAWSSEVGRLAGVELPVLPLRQHIFMLDALQEVTRTTPMTIDFASSLYFHPEGDGVLVGMSNARERPGFDTSVDFGFIDELVSVASVRAPAIADAGLRSAWAGLYEVTPDHQPIVGPVGSVQGLWCACGFSGHGFMQAPAIGLLLAQRWTDGASDIDLEPFAHKRFDHSLEHERAVI